MAVPVLGTMKNSEMPILASPKLKLDTTKPEGIELQGESGKISAAWHHAVVGRGDAVARRRSSGAAG